MAATEEADSKGVGLPGRQRAFVEKYLLHLNVSKAAREAGYKNPNSGYQLMQKEEVISEIERRFSRMAMRANEVIARLTEHARGSIEDFIAYDAYGIPHIDLAKGKDKLCVIRKLKKTQLGGYEIELYDAQAALVQLGKFYELFSERLNVRATVTGQVTVYIPDNGRDSTTEGAAGTVSGNAG